MLDGTQLRMARAALNWGRKTLAGRSGVAPVTISNIERFVFFPSPRSAERLRAALEEAGIVFVVESATGGSGILYKSAKTPPQRRPGGRPRRYTGPELIGKACG